MINILVGNPLNSINSSLEMFSNEFGQLSAYFIWNAVILNRSADILAAEQTVTAGNGTDAMPEN